MGGRIEAPGVRGFDARHTRDWPSYSRTLGAYIGSPLHRPGSLLLQVEMWIDKVDNIPWVPRYGLFDTS